MVAALLLASGVLLTFMSDARAGTTFAVNSTSDAADMDVKDSVCDADNSTPGSQCTLRAAIQQANTAMGADTIHFGIPGYGVHTIKLTSQLPPLTDMSGPTTIDGYTQAGSTANTAPRASNAKIKVQVEGEGGDLFSGLVIESPGNVVRGLALYKLRAAVKLLGTDAHNNRIVGNFLGTDATGRYRAAEFIKYGYASGVRLIQGASNNVIGGASVVDRNVLSGNASHGVGLYDTGTDSNVIVGNVIGLSPSGNGRLMNQSVGVDINYGASYNVVGGNRQGERNVISGNGREGVEVSHHKDTLPTANQVIGNFIGTSLTGERAPKYARNGGSKNLDAVHLTDGAKDSVVANNVIGNAGRSGIAIEGVFGAYTTGNEVYANRVGISRDGAPIPNDVAGIQILAGARDSKIGPKNVIAHNAIGVQVSDTRTDSNTITSNSIFSNTKLGIDLAPLGVANRNDPRDADRGANEQQNVPVVTSATIASGATTLKGNLNSAPNNTFRVEFFANPKGTNEGRAFIGQRMVTTGTKGKASFRFIPTKRVRSGRVITATLTDIRGNTSEFSAPRRVVRR